MTMRVRAAVAVAVLFVGIGTACTSSADDETAVDHGALPVEPTANTKLPPEEPPPPPWELQPFPAHWASADPAALAAPECYKDPFPPEQDFVQMPAYCIEIRGNVALQVGQTSTLECWGFTQSIPSAGQPAWPVWQGAPRHWSSSNDNVTQMNEASQFWTNTVTAVSPGTSTIRCQIDNAVGTVRVTVAAPPPTLSAIVVSGQSDHYGRAVGRFTHELRVRTYYSDGTSVLHKPPTSAMVFSTTYPDRVRVSQDGWVTADACETGPCAVGFSAEADIYVQFQGLTSPPLHVRYLSTWGGIE